MANVTKKIIEGVVYSVEEGVGYKVEQFECYEAHLKHSLNIGKSTESITVTGFIYKEDYKESPIEIKNNVELYIDNELIASLQPQDGVINIDITINDTEKHVLYFKENNIFGSFDVGGVVSE